MNCEVVANFRGWRRSCPLYPLRPTPVEAPGLQSDGEDIHVSPNVKTTMHLESVDASQLLHSATPSFIPAASPQYIRQDGDQVRSRSHVLKAMHQEYRGGVDRSLSPIDVTHRGWQVRRIENNVSRCLD
jgi:hypothetical protein